MLYDPKWEKQAETKADPLTLPALIAWLEQQPSEATYCYYSTGHCLIAQYLQAAGLAKSVGGHSFTPLGGGPRQNIPENFSDIAWDSPRTFGAALNRARAAANQNS